MFTFINTFIIEIVHWISALFVPDTTLLFFIPVFFIGTRFSVLTFISMRMPLSTSSTVRNSNTFSTKVFISSSIEVMSVVFSSRVHAITFHFTRILHEFGSITFAYAHTTLVPRSSDIPTVKLIAAHLGFVVEVFIMRTLWSKCTHVTSSVIVFHVITFLVLLTSRVSHIPVHSVRTFTGSESFTYFKFSRDLITTLRHTGTFNVPLIFRTGIHKYTIINVTLVGHSSWTVSVNHWRYTFWFPINDKEHSSLTTWRNFNTFTSSISCTS